MKSVAQKKMHKRREKKVSSSQEVRRRIVIVLIKSSLHLFLVNAFEILLVLVVVDTQITLKA